MSIIDVIILKISLNIEKWINFSIKSFLYYIGISYFCMKLQLSFHIKHKNIKNNLALMSDV